MNIVHGGRMDFTERHNPRGGTFHYKRLVEGRSGTQGNFGLMLSRTFDNFVSPRHRHNFEQIRFQIEGVCDFGRDGEMLPGTMGYFPEGAFYGPQSAGGPALVLVLQFGGPSGSGYMSEDDLQRSVAELATKGAFREGVFYRAESEEGRPRQDAYEAAWENHNGRKLDYPEPLYPAPMLIQHTKATATDSLDGVHVREYGAFEGGTAARVLRLESGAATDIAGPAVLFILAGSGVIGDTPIEAQASVHIEAGETVSMHSHAPIEVLAMQLPSLPEKNAIPAA